MPANTLQFETRVDLSGLNQGTAAASAAIGKFGTDVKTAMAAAATATNQLADAQIQLGQAASQGNAQAAAVIAEYQQQVNAANAAVAALSATEAEEDTVVKKALSDRMIATVALREMSMNFGNANRAAGAFLTTIPGIGAALQVAFPIFGVIALLEVFGQMAEKVHKIYDEFVNLKSEEDAFHKDLMADTEEEVRSSDRLLASIRQRDVVQAELQGGKAGRANRGQAAGTQFDVTQDKLALQSDADQIANLKTKMDALDAARKPLDNWFLHSPAEVIEHARTVKEAGIQYEQLTSKVTALSKDFQAVQQDLANKQDETSLRLREAGEKEDGAFERAQAKRLKGYEEEYNLEVLNGGKTLKFEYEFWAARLNLFADGSAQYDAILQKMAVSAEAAATRVHKALELMRLDEPIQAQDLLTGRKTDKFDEGDVDLQRGLAAAHQMVAASAEAARAAVAKLNIEEDHEKATGTFQTKETKVQAGATLGITDPLKDLELLRDLHQQAIAEDERYLQQVMEEDRLEAQQEMAAHATDGAKIVEIQARLNQELLALDKKLAADKQKSNQQMLNDTVKILQQEEQKYKQVYGIITNDFNSAINKMITTTEGPAKAFAQMLDQMLGQLATFVLQYLEKKAEMWLLDEILGKTSATASALTQITADAAVAGAGAYAATAVIPVVGPALAPAAATTAYAGALSFLGLAAFETGGVVGGGHGMPVPIIAHAGERVLSRSQTDTFHQMVSGTPGGGAGHTTHINYAPQVAAFDNSGLKSTLHAHRDTIVDIVRQAYKTGSLTR